MKRAFAAMMVLFAASSCRTTRVTVARLVTPTPTPVTASPPAAPARTTTSMPVVTAPSAPRYDRTPGVLYEEKSAPAPTATVIERRITSPAADAPARPTPTVTPARPTATARPPAPAVREAAPAARTPTPARPTAMPTSPAPTATPVPPSATSAPPTETRVPPRPTSTPTAAVSARPTATRKPGAYYEGEEVPFRLAVTWTFTPTPPVKRRS